MPSAGLDLDPGFELHFLGGPAYHVSRLWPSWVPTSGCCIFLSISVLLQETGMETPSLPKNWE
jgi:hypothetical protein